MKNLFSIILIAGITLVFSASFFKMKKRKVIEQYEQQISGFQDLISDYEEMDRLNDSIMANMEFRIMYLRKSHEYKDSVLRAEISDNLLLEKRLMLRLTNFSLYDEPQTIIKHYQNEIKTKKMDLASHNSYDGYVRRKSGQGQ